MWGPRATTGTLAIFVKGHLEPVRPPVSWAGTQRDENPRAGAEQRRGRVRHREQPPVGHTCVQVSMGTRPPAAG